MTSVQERLVALVASKPQMRRDVDIELALPWLRKKSELLQSLEKDTLKDVVRNCGYQRAEKDDVIIQQGERGNCFYIMLTGRTSVYIDTIRTDEEAPPETPIPKKESKHAPVKRSASKVAMDKKDDSSNQGNEKTETETPAHKKDKKGSLDRTAFGKFIMCFAVVVAAAAASIVAAASYRYGICLSLIPLFPHRQRLSHYMKA
ncbi:cAMP-dependent protein kinase regulatory subunit [Elysia marginata]|uniref:cAMP-dependent protein kinase regulatory subunit n=1 Tax=Elysia marginata TaxID=1093978 RepID=A0AAV4JKH3_9GAST|nr:cAMP-dependent protein kinase regulatory subunit [Elysia marginata]